MALLIREKRRGKWRRDCGGFPQHYKKIITAWRETQEGAFLNVCVSEHKCIIFIQHQCKWLKTPTHSCSILIIQIVSNVTFIRGVSHTVIASHGEVMKAQMFYSPVRITDCTVYGQNTQGPDRLCIDSLKLNAQLWVFQIFSFLQGNTYSMSFYKILKINFDIAKLNKNIYFPTYCS